MARGGTRKEPPARRGTEARPRRDRETLGRGAPPPLPPATRTVGQLVAESIRLYQRHVWKALAIGLLPGVWGVVATDFSRWVALAFAVVGAPVFTVSYLVACGVVGGVPVRGRPAATAFAGGVLVFLPFPFLASVFVLPGLAWLALFGLVVPVALIERRGLAGSFRRAQQLARADFVHVLGGLCTLAIAVVLTQGVVFILLRSFADTAARTSASLAGIVLSPLLFLGAALLYVDQAARVRSTPR